MLTKANEVVEGEFHRPCTDSEMHYLLGMLKRTLEVRSLAYNGVADALDRHGARLSQGHREMRAIRDLVPGRLYEGGEN